MKRSMYLLRCCALCCLPCFPLFRLHRTTSFRIAVHRQISIRSSWRRWSGVGFLFAWCGGGEVSPAQSVSNALSVEIVASGLRLHYILGTTNAAFVIVQSSRLEDIARAGQVLVFTNSTAGSTGVVDVPRPESNSFFALTPAPPGLRWIPPGAFTMGSPDSEPVRNPWEGPPTQVTLSHGFYMGRYEVTQGEYLAVMGNNPSGFTGDLNRPVERVTWPEAVAYGEALTARERNAGRLPAGYVYRLPTEAEWEYACRAGTTTPFHYGSALQSGMANFYGRCEYPPCGGDAFCCINPSGTNLERTTAVGSYVPNAWGLYDMHGNVWEWCSDWYSGNLPGGSVTDPQGPATGSRRVIRSGSWYNYPSYCRSAYRYEGFPTGRSNFQGFRVVLAQSLP